jgi:hypothetical protein
MAKLSINIGFNANDGTGDDLRTAMQKINTNFTELYGTTAEANDLVEDLSPQLGGNLDLQNYIITTSATNGNITLSPNGTGNVVLGALTINGTTVSSDNSSKITLAESVDVTGTLSASIIDTNIIQNSDSSAIQINDGVNINGILNVKDLIVNEISSEDSSAIEIKEKLNVSGTLSAPFIATNAIFSNDSSEIQFGTSISTAGTVSATSILTNTISSPDSSAVQIVDSLNVAGNISPSADNTYDLGSSGARWKDLHIMSGTIYMWDILNNYTTVTKQLIDKLNDMSNSGAVYQTDAYGGDAVLTNQFSNYGVSIQGNSGAPVTVNEIEVTAATITPTTPDTLELVGTTIVDELQVEGNEITPTTNDTYIVLTPTGTGKVTVDTLDIKDGEITPTTANTDITLSPTGTGRVVFDGATTQTVAGISLEIHAINQYLTVSVDCSLASIFKVILDTNVQFVINNLPTGGTVTLIVQQDGGGSRTATFGTESSTAVKFPGGAPTLTAAAGSIDVITIFNDGVNYLGEFKANYIP